MKHAQEIAKFVRNGDFEETSEGLLIHSSAILRGKYVHTVNGEDEQVDYNLIPAAGILHFLDVTLGATAKESAWYLALNGNNTAPAAGWTGANYTVNAAEITSQTEGYVGGNRPAWTPSPAAAGKIGNLASRASYTIACTTTLNVYGAGLLSTQPRGDVSGVLVSSSLFGSTRILNNGDTFELGYEVELTDS